jgi:hypothetical protein
VDDCEDDQSCGLDWWPVWGGPLLVWGGTGAPPLGTSDPNPTLPSGIPNTTGVYGQGQYGTQGWGVGPYGNGFADEIAQAAPWALPCVESGVCVTVVAGVVLVGAAIYGVWEAGTWIGHHVTFSKVSKKSGKEDGDRCSVLGGIPAPQGTKRDVRTIRGADTSTTVWSTGSEISEERSWLRIQQAPEGLRTRRSIGFPYGCEGSVFG